MAREPRRPASPRPGPTGTGTGRLAATPPARTRWIAVLAGLLVLAGVVAGVELSDSGGAGSGGSGSGGGARTAADGAHRSPATTAASSTRLPSHLYVAAELADAVVPIDLATGVAGPPMAGRPFPSALALASGAAQAGGNPSGPGGGHGAARRFSKVLWVADALDGTVTPVTLSNGRVGSAIVVGHGPRSLAVSAADGLMLVACSGSNEVVPVDTRSRIARPAVPVGAVPTAVVISPGGRTAWVANERSGTVTSINLVTMTAGAPIAVGSSPDALSLSPDGGTLWVALSDGGAVVPVDTAARVAGHPIPVGAPPAALSLSPDGRTLYVAMTNVSAPLKNATRTVGPSEIVPVDTAARRVGTPIPVGRGADALAMSADGRTLYVANYADNTVQPVATATDRAGAPLPVAAGPAAIAIG